MMKKAVIAIALTLLPVAASAQEHKHGDSTGKAQPSHTSTMKHDDHVNPVAIIMQKRAELKLTDEQIEKLEDMSARMQQHHAAMSKPGAMKMTTEDHARMHESLMSIFTEEQAEKVRAILKQHEEQCGGGQEKQCKMEPVKKKEVQ